MDRSLIAGANALFRAAETERRDAILEDRYAALLADRDPRIQAVRFGRFVIPPLARSLAELQVAHCVRHATIDTLVKQAAAEGYRIVIIGAGYDMRASRFGLDLVEVDHPATQARKLARLAGHDVRPVKRYALDLLVDDLPEFEGRTCFVLEGFLHYLSPHRFDALLALMAKVPGAQIVASYIRTEMYLRAGSMFVELVKLVREIPRLHFTPAGLETRLAAHGFSEFRSYDAATQIASFVPRARGRSIGLSQDVAVAYHRRR